MKLVFLTENLELVDNYNGTYVEVLQEISPTEVEVRFFDGETAVINPNDLLSPELVPFKVGDKVKNLKGFTLNTGAYAWSGITWEIQKVFYSPPDLSNSVLVCNSSEFAVFGKYFVSNEVEKI